ncbi:hypothetical protein Pelo_891 [Pelomyxa schiedti]|nr:hypothetical protein Pelo_891 [Pelomyxa schiedti]
MASASIPDATPAPIIVKKVVILYYSLTGNTRYVAERIAEGLCSYTGGRYGYDVRVFGVVRLIKEQYYGGPAAPMHETAAALADSLGWADVVGCGSMCTGGMVTGGLSQFLADLPAEVVRGKPGFVFTTAGQTIGSANVIMAESLMKAGVRPVLSQWALMPCPDTWIWCLPSRPMQLLWGSNVIDTAITHGRELAGKFDRFFFDGSAVSVVPDGAKSHVRTVDQDKWMGSKIRQLSVPEIMCDNSKCLKCGRCSTVCPTNSMTSSRGEFPVWKKATCCGCTACVANCPAFALQVRNMKHKQYWTFKKEYIKEGDNNWTVSQMRMWTVKSGLWRIASSKKMMICGLFAVLTVLSCLRIFCHKRD